MFGEAGPLDPRQYPPRGFQGLAGTPEGPLLVIPAPSATQVGRVDLPGLQGGLHAPPFERPGAQRAGGEDLSLTVGQLQGYAAFSSPEVLILVLQVGVELLGGDHP
jgi:hypothetical protein